MREVSIEKDILHLKDMLLYIEKSREVIVKANRYHIPLDDDMVISAIAMNLGQIGEQLSMGKLSSDTKERFSDVVNWSKIKAFRNFIYHDYGRLDFVKLKRILDVSLPKTEEQLQYVLKQLQKEN